MKKNDTGAPVHISILGDEHDGSSALPPAKAPRAPKAPSNNDMLLSRAHAAHRDVVDSWIRGEKTDKHLAQSRNRLKKVVADCKGGK